MVTQSLLPMSKMEDLIKRNVAQVLNHPVINRINQILLFRRPLALM